ncbi:unnamed protein product [Lepidochelys kempii]
MPWKLQQTLYTHRDHETNPLPPHCPAGNSLSKVIIIMTLIGHQTGEAVPMPISLGVSPPNTAPACNFIILVLSPGSSCFGSGQNSPGGGVLTKTNLPVPHSGLGRGSCRSARPGLALQVPCSTHAHDCLPLRTRRPGPGRPTAKPFSSVPGVPEMPVHSQPQAPRGQWADTD